MNQNEPETDLIEYLNVLWKRRWLIIIPTFLLAVIAGVVSFFMPPVWKVDAVIQPGKYFVQSPAGTSTEIIAVDPAQLAGQINQGSYERMINAQLNLDPGKFPKLKAENPKGAKVVRVSIQTGEAEQAKAILNALFGHVKNELDRKIDVEMKNIIAPQITTNENNIQSKTLDIQSKNIDIEKTRQAIVTAGKKLSISEECSRRRVEEMKGVKTRINQIEQQQKTLLAEKKERGDALGLLLYSNEIQQNFRYYDSLEEELNKERINQEEIKLLIRDKEQEIKGLKNQIEKFNREIAGIRSNMELLAEKKQRIDYTQLVKEPTVSTYPVYPKRMLNVAIAGFLGLLCFSILALFLNAIEMKKVNLKTNS